MYHVRVCLPTLCACRYLADVSYMLEHVTHTASHIVGCSTGGEGRFIVVRQVLNVVVRLLALLVNTKQP